MSKAVKLMELDAIREEFKGVQDMVVIGVNKLDCAADTLMRSNLRKKKIRLRRVKNSMAKKVFSSKGWRSRPTTPTSPARRCTLTPLPRDGDFRTLPRD